MLVGEAGDVEVVRLHKESNTIITVAGHGDVEPSCRRSSELLLPEYWMWLINRAAMALTWKSKSSRKAMYVFLVLAARLNESTMVALHTHEMRSRSGGRN